VVDPDAGAAEPEVTVNVFGWYWVFCEACPPVKQAADTAVGRALEVDGTMNVPPHVPSARTGMSTVIGKLATSRT
jgi:hypothetical protein